MYIKLNFVMQVVQIAGCGYSHKMGLENMYDVIPTLPLGKRSNEMILIESEQDIEPEQENDPKFKFYLDCGAANEEVLKRALKVLDLMKEMLESGKISIPSDVSKNDGMPIVIDVLLDIVKTCSEIDIEKDVNQILEKFISQHGEKYQIEKIEEKSGHRSEKVSPIPASADIQERASKSSDNYWCSLFKKALPAATVIASCAVGIYLSSNK